MWNHIFGIVLIQREIRIFVMAVIAVMIAYICGFDSYIERIASLRIFQFLQQFFMVKYFQLTVRCCVPVHDWMFLSDCFGLSTKKDAKYPIILISI
jgi:hypothetical protein